MSIFSVLFLTGPLLALLVGIITGTITRRGWFGIVSGIMAVPLLLALGISWVSGLLAYVVIYSVIGLLGSWIGCKLIILHTPGRPSE